MPTVRLALCDLAADWNPRDNYFTRALTKRGYTIQYCTSPADKPDFVLCGTFGHQALDYDCCRIQFSGEDSWPDLNLYDYAMGFPDFAYQGRYLRLPLYAMRDTWAPALHKHEHPDAYYLDRPGFCCCVVSNDFSAERNAFMETLMQRGLLDSGGGYRNNVGGPVADKTTFQQNYRFALAYENSADPGYCTEKIADAFAAGAVPVYWGDPEVKGEFNPESFLCAADYPDENALIQAMQALAADKDAYLKVCRAPILAPDGSSRAAAYADDETCFRFLDGIFRRGPHLRRNRSCWGSIYENDRKYHLRLAEEAARPKTLGDRLADLLRGH